MRSLSAHTLRRSLLCALVPALAPSVASAAWETNIAYGGNMPADLYTPPTPADPAALVISLHTCGGNKGNAQQWFKSSADSMGFYIITPQAGGNCFDATAAKGGERAEIIAMIDWAIAEHGVDPRLVFAAGASSGACMTQALLAAYPDRFAAGSSLAGVPAGAWTGGNAYGFSTPSQSDEAWGDKVRQINQGYTGPWPRMQIWHGEGDTNLTYSQNWPAETGQWTNVWGFDVDADGTAESIKPAGAQDTWTRKSYVADNDVLGVETNTVAGVPHDLTGRGLWGDVVRFFAPDTLPPEVEPGTGGTTGAGGSAGTGGAVGAGGSGSGTGGASAGVGGTGGPGTGGTAAGTGGLSAGTGGVSAGTGGASAGAGGTATGTGGTSTGPGPVTPAGGCSFGGGTTSSSIWGLLGVAALGLMLGRRRQVG